MKYKRLSTHRLQTGYRNLSANVFSSVRIMTTSVFSETRTGHRVIRVSINHPKLRIIPSDFRRLTGQNPHHLILLISNSYENAKAKRLRFGYRIYKLSMNFRMQQHRDANNGESRTQSQTCLSYAEAQPIECNL